MPENILLFQKSSVCYPFLVTLYPDPPAVPDTPYSASLTLSFQKWHKNKILHYVTFDIRLFHST